MSILVMGTILVLLNFIVNKIAGLNRKKWLISGAITMILLAPLVYILTLNIIGSYSGGGIGASFAGFVFATITFVNGLIFLGMGLFSKKVPY
ncbi:MAG: hypothetical protein N2A99_00355 [Carnobacterium alterfunditum]